VVYNFYNHQHARQTTTMVGSIMAKLNSQELITQSDAIVVGTVQKTEVAKVPSVIQAGKDDIVTNATISVDKYLYNPKNLTSNEIVVQTIGGVIENQTMIAEDSPILGKGQRVVVFLRQAKDGVFIVFGGLQGKYSVNEDGTVGSENERDVFINVFGRQMNLDELGKVVASITSVESTK